MSWRRNNLRGKKKEEAWQACEMQPAFYDVAEQVLAGILERHVCWCVGLKSCAMLSPHYSPLGEFDIRTHH